MVRIKIIHHEGVIHHSSGSKKGRGGKDECDGVGPSSYGIHTPVKTFPFRCTTSLGKWSIRITSEEFSFLIFPMIATLFKASVDGAKAPITSFFRFIYRDLKRHRC
ncbi:hypothetical protein E1A91_D11G272400v1 [Gossypium mustelinum]|uniref:Uncharacterized protein n=1 Tax=Gossypium mustelinum TaxID=34275 RepID=A0A5D2SWU2_GOSMU|nr:hypothetical protein E1A91_D11G272400v1 [Gossypium mustelinum]